MSAKKMHAIPYAQFSTEMRSGKIIKIDDRGRVNLTIKGVSEEEKAQFAEPQS